MDALAWTTFALSVVGALAWIPAIREWLQKPDVHIVSAEQIEVSYMEFGGVLNIACTFASFEKAALVESLSLSLQHEDGGRSEFFCSGLSESTTAQSSSGERVYWNRETRVHALAVPQDSAVERLVMFRDRAQSSAVRRLYERVLPVWERLKANEGEVWRDAMRRTPEFDEYLRSVRDGQSWRRGKYSAVLTSRVRQLSKPLQHKFTFELAEADMRAVRSNLDPLNTFVSGVLLQAEPPAQRPIFSFAFPARVLEGDAHLPVIKRGDS